MKVAEYVGLASGVLSIFGALQPFFNADFSLKLLALGVTGLTVLWVTARKLANWISGRKAVGFNVIKTSLTSRTKLFVAVLAIGLVSFTFVLTAWLVVKWDALNVEVAVASDRTAFWIHGSRREVSRLTVLVPPHGDCAPIVDTGHLAQTTVNDWSTLNPYLEISNFSYPQRQGVSCESRITVDQLELRPEPAATQVFDPERRLKYFVRIFIIGGVTWIAFGSFAIWRSR